MKDLFTMKENLSLKKSLILQSFAPLFILLFIKHFHFSMPGLIINFIRCLKKLGFQAVEVAITHPRFWDLVLTLISAGWLLATICIMLGFSSIQKAGFISKGESITLVEEKSDVGITFLVSFVLPLLVDDVTCLRNFLFFTTLMCMVINLLVRSNLYYQNPILSLFGYKVCTFQITNPGSDIREFAIQRSFIGITRGKRVSDKATIKRKYIADDVFMIYND